MINTSPIEVAKFVRNTKKSHSSHCGISGKFLSLISQEISYSLSTLFNNHFEIGYFPDIWKIAHVTPVYKRNGPKNDKNNFRPISILPTLSKVCESVIHERLLMHCVENDVISHRQAAYLKGDSTMTQLLYIQHQIRLSWGKSHITQAAFLDISAAFDKVWHNGLLAKLNQIGIDGPLFWLFKCYLSNRKQCVIVEGEKSSLKDIQSGVPQGSRLGPLLFLIFINDIVQDIESEILIFADDTTLLASGADPAETSAKLNRDLAKITAWAEKWKVSFNAKKSKDMIFSNKTLNNSPPLIFNNVTIERVNLHKHLGIIFQSNLDWTAQINDICIKANRKLSVLRSVKQLSRKTLDLLYKLTVRSLIDYSLPIFANNLKLTEIKRLENLQYRAARVVTGALNFTSRERLFEELGWETIANRTKFLGLCMFHKIHVHESRPLIRTCLTKLDWEKKCYLRSKGGYVPYPYFNQKFLNSFFPFISKQWNNLPNSTKSKNLYDFKEQLKTDIKPERHKHFSFGPKDSNQIMTRFRTGRTNLNLNRFTIGLSDDPSCLCHEKYETSEHFIMDCFIYGAERQNLFNLVEYLIPKFSKLNRKQKFEILTRGIDIDNPEFFTTNIRISLAVQTFIMKTKRF